MRRSYFSQAGKSYNTCMKLFLTAKGSGEIPILFFHGLWGGGNYFRRFDFSNLKNSTQYFPDALGFGKSEKPNIQYTIEQQCSAIFEAIPQNKKYILIGNSYGATLVLHFAKRYPHLIQKIILISPVIHSTSEEARKYLS